MFRLCASRNVIGGPFPPHGGRLPALESVVRWLDFSVCSTSAAVFSFIFRFFSAAPAVEAFSTYVRIEKYGEAATRLEVESSA